MSGVFSFFRNPACKKCNGYRSAQAARENPATGRNQRKNNKGKDSVANGSGPASSKFKRRATFVAIEVFFKTCRRYCLIANRAILKNISFNVHYFSLSLRCLMIQLLGFAAAHFNLRELVKERALSMTPKMRGPKPNHLFVK